MADEHITVVGHKAPPSFFNKRYLKFEIIGGLDMHGRQIILNARGDTSLTLAGFRASVEIMMAGGYSLPEMSAEIYNLPSDLTNLLSTLGTYNIVPSTFCNQIIIYASTDKSEPEKPFYVKIFEGAIINAYVDYGGAPEAVFHLQAQLLGGLNMRGLPAVAFNGEVSKVDVIKAIIDNFKQSLNADNANNTTNDPKGGFLDRKTEKRTLIKSVQNRGVQGVFNNPHYYGDLTTQLYKAASDGQFAITASSDGVLYMYPQGGSLTPDKEQDQLPLISPRFGMIGYPVYCSQGLIIRSVFRPDLLFGQAVQIYSTIQPACGIWPSMVSMRHSLSSLIPDGPWETQLVMAKRQIQGSVTDDHYANQS